MSGRILIVDVVPTNRIVMRVKLAAAFYEVAQAASGRAALRAIRRSRPDLVIAAADLPDMTGQAFCAALRKREPETHLPVVLIHDSADPSERLASLAAGADDVLPRPIDDLVLLARLRSLLRASDAEAELQLRDDTRRALGLAEAPGVFETPARIAIVPLGPPSPEAGLLCEALRTRLSDEITLMTPDTALRTPSVDPDVVVLIEARSGQAEGLALLSQLRAYSRTRHAALIYVAQEGQGREAASALDMGANDLLAHGPDPEELALRLRSQITRKRVGDRLRANMRDGLRAAVIDPLTGLYNRRYAASHVTRVSDRAATQRKPYALLLADLDHFKHVNDAFGHLAGDAVLRAIADRLRDNLRAADLVARYGGEEFLIVMPDTGAQSARQTAERLCALMRACPVTLPDGQEVPVTLSIGVAIGHARNTPNPEDLIESADRALYAAKDQGRNRVVLADRVTPLRGKRTEANPGQEPFRPMTALPEGTAAAWAGSVRGNG